MTNKKNVSLIALLLSVMFIFSSCSREEIAPTPDNPNPALSSGLNYNQIGQHHNAILQGLGNDPSFSASLVNGPAAPLVATMVPIAEQVTACNPNCNQGSYASGSLNTISNLATLNDFADLGNQSFANGRINGADRDAYHDLDGLVYNAMNISQPAFQQTLLTFENQVRNDQSLSQTGRTSLLAGSTVMRYSDIFWHGVRAAGPSNPWYAIDKGRIKAALPWYVKDAMGAAAAAENPWTWAFGPWVAGGIIATAAAVSSAIR